MGVLVFVLAVSPMANGDSGDALHLLRAESPGVNVGKLVPRMRRSTTILYLIYIGLTVLMFVLLIFDMPFFDALTTAFATAGTGDVLAGMIGAMFAQKFDMVEATLSAVWLHGRAVEGIEAGVTASSVARLAADLLDRMRQS